MSHSPQMMQVGTWDWRYQQSYGVNGMAYAGAYYVMTPPQPQYVNDGWAVHTPAQNAVWQQAQKRPAQRVVQPPKAKTPTCVCIRNIPSRLCDTSLVEAMLEQAGLENCVSSCEVNPGAQHGEVVLRMNSHDSAVRCVRHFHRRRWEGVEVVAEIKPFGNHSTLVAAELPATPPKCDEFKYMDSASTCVSSTASKPSPPSTPSLGTRTGRARKNWADLSSEDENGLCSDWISTTNNTESDQAAERFSSDESLS